MQLGVIQEQVAELKKWREETDRKRWQVTVTFLGCLLALLVQIVIITVKK